MTRRWKPAARASWRAAATWASCCSRPAPALADLSNTLTALRAETDRFYRFHARGGELAELKARLATLKAEREAIDTAAAVYVMLIETRDRAWAAYDEAIAARTAIRARMDAIQRQVTALPRLAALRSARERLEPLLDLPAAPAGWPDALRSLQAEEVPILVQSETIEREVAQRVAEREAIVVDDAALAVADRFDRLGALQARHVTADKDIPVRRQEVAAANLAIGGLLARIGRDGEPDPSRLLFDAATLGTLNALIARRSGIETAVEAAARELVEARERLQEAVEALHDADGGVAAGASSGALAATIEALRHDDHAARRRLADQARAGLLETLAERLRGLQPWTGDAEELAAVIVPEQAQLQAWKAALEAARKRHDGCAADVERLTTARLQLMADRDAIALGAGVVSDRDAASIRAAREAAWAAHRRALDAASADGFEAVLRQDDRVMDARLHHQADVARLHQTAAQLARTEAEAARAATLLEAATARLQAVEAEVAAAMAPVLPDSGSLVQFEGWLEKRRQALEIRAALKQEERALRQAEADGTAARRRLLDALAAAGVAHDAAAPLDALRATAQGALDRETALQGLRAAVEQRRRDVKARERAMAGATAREAEWEAAWRAACAGSWLGEAATLAAVREILPVVAALGPAVERRASLLERIDAMQRDQAAFAAEVAAIAGEAGMAADDAPLAVAQAIGRRVQAARMAQTRRAGVEQALAEARERQRKLAESLAIHARRKAEMTGFFGVATLTEVAGRLAAIETRSALMVQAGAAEREVLEGLGVATVAEAEQILDAADRPALEAELADLTARFDDQDRRTHDLFSIHSKAVDQVEAVGGDAAAARIEEQRRTVLLEIEEGARRYLRLRAGIAAAEHALRSYRQQHRSAMMTQASDAFRTISRDAYLRLASQPARENEVLVAVSADGSSKIASELSKGTRFQLYLALRVAGYHEFARLRSPVPFVADDIMETFDDFRAEEALKLLGGMAAVGQVIYLTHHRHLCDIARRVCPGVRVHELTVEPAPALSPG